MRYLGGKDKIAKWIRDTVITLTEPYGNICYVEPFMGSGAVLRHLAPRFERVIANDLHPDLVRMWAALIAGWEPPLWVTKEEYKRLQNMNTPSPERGYAGFCLSYGGKWWGGWMLPDKQHSNKRERLSVMRRARAFRHARLFNTDYEELVIPPGSFIYCDPPYDRTEEYRDTSGFNHPRFWRACDRWVENGAMVLVSEYQAPTHWPSIDTRRRCSTLGLYENVGGKRVLKAGDWRTEHLFFRRP